MGTMEPLLCSEVGQLCAYGIEVLGAKIVVEPHLEEGREAGFDPGERGGIARAWLVKYPRAVPAAIFFAIAAITAFGVFAIESNAHQRERAEVREYAQSIANALERQGNNFSAYLRAGAALLSTIDEVEPDKFRQFVAELRLDQNYRGAEGIGWVATVTPAGAEDFLDRTRSLQPGYPGIRPSWAENADMIAPVVFFAPDTLRNSRTLGFDMYSEPVRAAAMDEAKRTVQPTASGRIVLAQEGAGEAPGFVIFMPVYKPVEPGNSLERELAGFVFSSFNAAQFLDSAIDRVASSELGVRLYDGEASTSHLLVSRSLVDLNADRFEQPVRIANRELLLVIEFSGAQKLAPLSMFTLVFGLAVASLLMLVARLLTQQALEDRARLKFYEEQHSIRNSLSRELNHRVKNTLANVLSILALTRRRASDLDDFADSLEGRVRALSATHDLLTNTDWGTTPIRSVIEAELGHCVEASEQSVLISGPDLELAPNDALSFGLAIHELATNAAKFGALSVPGGSIDVSWYLESDELAMVEWKESGGPPVPEERARGFGTDLIEKVVAHELKHSVQLKFERGGVSCVMGVPVRRRSEFQIRERSQGSRR